MAKVDQAIGELRTAKVDPAIGELSFALLLAPQHQAVTSTVPVRATSLPVVSAQPAAQSAGVVPVLHCHHR
jgi:hypothetical protein